MENKLKEAVETLCQALREDKTEGSYYYSWQANIAMAFWDEASHEQYKGEVNGWEGAMLDKKELHIIANNAAKRFLDSLIYVSNGE